MSTNASRDYNGRCLYVLDAALESNYHLDYSNFEFIAALVRNLASLPLLKSLLARDNITMRIEEAHVRLTDSLVAFQVFPPCRIEC